MPDLLVLPKSPISSNPALAYLASLTTPGSMRTQRSALSTVARLLGASSPVEVPWTELKYAHILALRAELIQHYAPATVNRTLSAIKGTTRCAWRMGLIPAEEYERIKGVKGIANHTLPAGR